MIFDAYDTKTAKHIATLTAPDLATAIKRAKSEAKLYQFEEIELEPDSIFVCAAPSDAKETPDLRRYGHVWHIA